MLEVFFSSKYVEHRAEKHIFSMPIDSVGDWFIKAFSNSYKVKEVHNSSNRLLHQMGGSWAFAIIVDQKVIDFVWKFIVCKFRVPKVLITNNKK